MSDDVQTCHACGASVSKTARFCTECGAALTDRPQVSSLETLPPENGGGGTLPPRSKATSETMLDKGDEVAGKFVVESLIGQGGMGAVYLARETLTNRPVALKIIRAENVGDQAAINRLINEGITTRDLAHPNIVRVYDIGMHGNQPYIAMEYIAGKPLHVWRSEKMASNDQVQLGVISKIIEEILKGLKTAHEAGVIHRDLKPENILLVDEPSATKASVKIVDFGIALATRLATGAGTSTGIGTQLYMAPEQIRNPDLATPAADLYSLSKIFYELLIGVLPTGHWQPPSGSRSDVPERIDQLIETGLSNAPSARPQSAQQYLDLLADPQSPVPGPRPQPNWLVYGGIAAGAVIAIGIAINMFSTEPTPYDRDRPDEIVDIFEPETPDDDEQLRQLELAEQRAIEAEERAREAERQRQRDLERQREAERIRREEDERRRRELEQKPKIAFDKLTDFSGRWTENGAAYDISVSSNGQFQGSGIVDGVTISLSGMMNFQAIQYQVYFNGVYAGEGTATRTDHCHFYYTNVYTDLSSAAGQLHVRHNPNATECP